MKLLGYTRISTDLQAQQKTIEIQHKALTEYAESNGHDLIRIFSDNGLSGSKDLENRPALASLFAYIELQPDIEGVLIYKLDRLARDLYIQEHLLKKLQDMNKTLVSIQEPDICSADCMRRAFRQFLGIISELERSFIAMRLSAGKIRKAGRGGFPGGRIALGYKTEGKELSIDAESVETVKTIFSLRERSYTLREIAAFLNDNNYPTSKGGLWHARTVKYILDNKLYRGVLRYKSVSVPRQDLALI